MDDVLSLFQSDEEESEFSGFEQVEAMPVSTELTRTHKADVAKGPDVVGPKKKGKSKEKTSTKKATVVLPSSSSCSASANLGQPGSAKTDMRSVLPKPVPKRKNTIDLDNLSEADIQKLRQVIGIESVPPAQFLPYESYEDDIQGLYGDTLDHLAPKMHVEVENDGMASDIEIIPGENVSVRPPLRTIENDISNALYDIQPQHQPNKSCDEVVTSDNYMWQLPKLKQPVKGSPISPSLASLINMACTTQCDTDELVTKYKLPSNCEMMSPPLVNSEIWNDINKRAQTYDKAFRDIQSLIASGITPIFELLDILKEQIQSNEKARTLISDSITLLGQAQFNLSLRRRYMIRPSLKKKYANLCNINTPISTFLFGDDVHKEIKKCDTGLSITRDQYFNVPQHMNLRGRARGRAGPYRGPNYQGYGGRGYYRYQPYGGVSRPSAQFGQYRYPFPKKSRRASTVTSLEDRS